MNRIKAAKYIFFFFFSIGTFLLIIQFIAKDIGVITICGYYYVLLSILLNCIVLIGLIACLILEKNKIDTLKAIGVVLLNAPIAYLYFILVIDYII